jgi:hypothetical protein
VLGVPGIFRTCSLGRRLLPLLAVVVLLSFGERRATAGCIPSDGLAPFAEAGLLDGPAVCAAGEPTDAFANYDPTNPDGPTPSGSLNGCTRTPACPCRPPSGGRSPRSSVPGVDGSCCHAAATLADLQLVTSFRASSAVTAPSGPSDAIFHPPRISA